MAAEAAASATESDLLFRPRLARNYLKIKGPPAAFTETNEF
jgi:hypothetical protein